MNSPHVSMHNASVISSGGSVHLADFMLFKP